ncbi:hypothetical protein COTS27_01668 [Spirochaetota bacterium]|nr:hypothetical protein COTS27_01668 [Spirochaetota bacterium]
MILFYEFYKISLFHRNLLKLLKYCTHTLLIYTPLTSWYLSITAFNDYTLMTTYIVTTYIDDCKLKMVINKFKIAMNLTAIHQIAPIKSHHNQITSPITNPH